MNEKMQGHAWEVDGHKVQCLTCGMVQTQETAGTKCGVYPLEPTPPASHDAGEADQLKALAYAMLAHGYGKDSQLVIGAAERIATLTAELAEARAEVERLREAARSAATDIVDGYYKTAGQTLYYALSASGREGE